MSGINVFLATRSEVAKRLTAPLEILREGRFAILSLDPETPITQQVREADVIIPAGSQIDSAVMDAAPRLRLIIQYGVGLDTVDIPAATERKIYVANVPGGNATAIAELALMHMLNLARKYPLATRNARTATWAQPVGCELYGKTVGIVGLGNAGSQLAVRCQALGMKVLAVRAHPTGQPIAGVDFLGGPQDLDYLLNNSDFVSVHVPLNDETRGMINAERFAKMKPTAFLINTSRGPVIHREALIEALQSGRLAGAGLDVFQVEPTDPDDILLSMDNVIATPHVAAATAEADFRIGQQVTRDVLAVMAGDPPQHCVNLQQLQLETV